MSRPIPLVRFFLLLALLLHTGCTDGGDAGPGSRDEVAELLYVWATDADSVDLNFLAVVDADPASAGYGTVRTTLPVPTRGRTRGHHTEHRTPPDGRLFANDFGTGKTYVLDLTDPRAPAVADSFTAAGPLMSPHSFERLPNGHVLATFQNEGPGNDAAGGLAELRTDGTAIRWSRAGAPGRYVRPYSLAVVPSLDRVVTGSADMRGEGDSRVLQVWRLGDLGLAATLDLPEEWGAAAEPRVLRDGETVLVSTFGCRLLRVDGLDGGAPSVTVVHTFQGEGCALPVVAGDHWIQTVPAAHALVALDVSRPGEPREVARLTLGEDDWPHWIALSPDGRRIVVTGYAGTRHRILLVDVDPSSGAMTVDEDFRDPGSDRPGISFDRRDWPHGASGPADPHGAVFSGPVDGLGG